MILDTIPADRRDDVAEFLLALGDDEFFMGNRLSRWVGSGPTLEEDNALSSILQDEIGHARLWYEIVADWEDSNVTQLAQTRTPDERRHSMLVEPDHQNFADTIVRNFLYDWAEERLVKSIYDGEVDELSSRAEVVLKEEHYHREHAEGWLTILTSTEEGREKLETALETNLPRARDYFAFDEATTETLLETGVIADDFDDLQSAWIDDLSTQVESLDLDVETPGESLSEPPKQNGRAGEHSETLTEIVDNLYPTKNELYPAHTDLEGDIRYGEKIGLE